MCSYLYWKIVRAEAEVITTTQRGKLRAHVHLQVLEEVMILKTDETNTFYLHNLKTLLFNV